MIVGCGGDDTTSKTSLFEHDHAVADHWPSDLADVAAKLRERLNNENVDEHTTHEIEDLVSWTAEIAADTNLCESDWLPLYHASESLMANLRAAKGKLTDENREQLRSLCNAIDEAATKIPEQYPNLVKGE
ncbi:hypothetical protein RMSM_02394 [Rhodopirellula maiorica SM1]|uniref:Uncharacterized protein n=1 Tax=Rhodopirellula maiorica SM1 TaxID=1265738 RepID=M5RN93_9BACT|nr:hypothetical protein RMSM_02394 [Rhodopirellula maiorica SM1]